MLTNHDIDFIKRNRTEITQNRTDSVILTKETTTGDPFTGGETVITTVVVDATCRSATGSADVEYVNGVEVVSGDVLANFDIALDLTDVTEVEFEGEPYSIKASDSVGLGEDNRYFVLLRRVT